MPTRGHTRSGARCSRPCRAAGCRRGRRRRCSGWPPRLFRVPSESSASPTTKPLWFVEPPLAHLPAAIGAWQLRRVECPHGVARGLPGRATAHRPATLGERKRDASAQLVNEAVADRRALAVQAVEGVGHAPASCKGAGCAPGPRRRAARWPRISMRSSGIACSGGRSIMASPASSRR